MGAPPKSEGPHPRDAAARTLSIFSLNSEAAWHLAYSLRRYLKWCDSVGLAVPEDVAQIERMCTFQVTGGQGRTALDSPNADMHDQIIDPMVVTYGTAAQCLSVSRRTIARMVADGRLIAVKVGGQPRIPTEQLRRLAATRTKD